MKRGLYTTEFWLTLLSVVLLPVLLLSGILTPEQWESIAGLSVLSTVSLWKYIQSRTELKFDWSLLDDLLEIEGNEEVIK